MEKILNRLIWIVLGLILLVPIYVNSDFFYPYIFSKTLAFRVLTEILLLLWLLYLWVRKQTQVKVDWLIIVFGLYILASFVSGLFGVNFYFSFWSNTERSEGLILWLHLFTWFFILRNFLGEQKHWRGLFDVFFISAQVVAVLGFLQYAGADFINQTGIGDDRVASTIGNAAYLAGYLLFAVFIGLYLSVYRHRLYLRLYYWLFVILDLFVALQTGTRGAFIAFIASVVLFFAYNISKISSRRIRLGLLGAAMVFILLVALMFANRSSSFVQDNTMLRRITSISLTERTAQTRLMAWNSAWQGFQQRPVLGYGQETFQYVFNKYFNPQIYMHAGSRIWYDRAHNIFLDHLVAGGIVGLILYTWLIFWPLWLIFKKSLLVRSDGPTIAERVKLGEQMLFLAIFTFVIQGLLVFEALVTYLPLMLIMAVISIQYLSAKYVLSRRSVFNILLLIYVLAIGPLMYYVNIREAQANLTLVRALRLQSVDINKSVDTYFQAIDMNTSGRHEYSRLTAEFIDGLVVNKKVTPYEALRHVQRIDRELEKRRHEFPSDVANLLLSMRHYNYTYILDPGRLSKVLELGEQALGYSPTRPQLYHEIGYAYIYLYQLKRGEADASELKQYQEAVLNNFDRALELNPFVAESYANIIMALLASDQSDKVQKYIDQISNFDELFDYDPRINQVPRFREEQYNRMANAAVSAQDFNWALHFFQILQEQYPDNPEYYISVALSYANLDKKDEAIAVAEAVKKFGGQYELQADEFIKKITSGTFEKIK